MFPLQRFNMPKTNAIQVLCQLLTAILLSFPAVLLVLPAGRRASLYLLLLCAFACMALRIRPAGQTFRELLKKHWPIHAAMMAMLVAVLVQQLVHWEFSFKAIEKALEFAVFPLLLWTLLLLPIKRLQVLQWALMIGVGISSIALYKATQGGSVRVDGVISSPSRSVIRSIRGGPSSQIAQHAFSTAPRSSLIWA